MWFINKRNFILEKINGRKDVSRIMYFYVFIWVTNILYIFFRKFFENYVISRIDECRCNLYGEG